MQLLIPGELGLPKFQPFFLLGKLSLPELQFLELDGPLACVQLLIASPAVLARLRFAGGLDCSGSDGCLVVSSIVASDGVDNSGSDIELFDAFLAFVGGICGT